MSKKDEVHALITEVQGLIETDWLAQAALAPPPAGAPPTADGAAAARQMEMWRAIAGRARDALAALKGWGVEDDCQVEGLQEGVREFLVAAVGDATEGDLALVTRAFLGGEAAVNVDRRALMALASNTITVEYNSPPPPHCLTAPSGGPPGSKRHTSARRQLRALLELVRFMGAATPTVSSLGHFERGDRRIKN